MIDTDIEYNTTDLAKQAGLSYRQLDFWCRNEVIPGASHFGSGRRRHFDARDMWIVCVLARLSRLNAPYPCLHEVSHFLYGYEHEDLQSAMLDEFLVVSPLLPRQRGVRVGSNEYDIEIVSDPFPEKESWIVPL